jgi:hypothetical protein
MFLQHDGLVWAHIKFEIASGKTHTTSKLPQLVWRPSSLRTMALMLQCKKYALFVFLCRTRLHGYFRRTWTCHPIIATNYAFLKYIIHVNLPRPHLNWQMQLRLESLVPYVPQYSYWYTISVHLVEYGYSPDIWTSLYSRSWRDCLLHVVLVNIGPWLSWRKKTGKTNYGKCLRIRRTNHEGISACAPWTFTWTPGGLYSVSNLF